MKAQNIGFIGLVVYVVIGIATFGNAVLHFDGEGEKAVIRCKAERINTDYCWMHRSDGFAAVASTLLWPLYWSYRIAKSAA